MSDFISLSQAFDQWRELAAAIPPDDSAMMSESWNDYTDALCKEGEITALQYHYAPAYDDPMPGHGTRFDELSDDRAYILNMMNITMHAIFVPFSQSRNRKEKDPSLNWRITLLVDGRVILSDVDYMQGSGHCPAYKRPALFPSGRRDEWKTRQHIIRECETGKRAGQSGAIPAPDLSDVLYSLLSDADAVDASDFADWCENFGFSDDSISAKAAYDASLATGLKLCAAFGKDTLNDLRELFSTM